MGPSFPPLKGTTPNFRPMSVVAKPLDGLRCHLVRRLALAQAPVFDGDPAPLQKKRTQPPPNLWPMSTVAKRLDGWRRHLVRKSTSARPHCVRRGPTKHPPPRERGTAAPSFRPMSIVATVANLSNCWALVQNYRGNSVVAYLWLAAADVFSRHTVHSQPNGRHYLPVRTTKAVLVAAPVMEFIRSMRRQDKRWTSVNISLTRSPK